MSEKKICIEIAKREERSVIMITDLKGNVEQYVGCSYFDNRKPFGEKWHWGHYFGNDVKSAMDWLYDVPKMPIPYERLSELATLFKDGLVEDDKEQAMMYFKETCDMTTEEMKYFGIECRQWKLVELKLEKTSRVKVKVLVPQDEDRISINWDEYIGDTTYLDLDIDFEEWNLDDYDVVREGLSTDEARSKYCSDEVWNYDDLDEE